MIGLDTTVLVAHEVEEAPGHERVRAHIASASRTASERYALAPQVLQEFLHVVTDPRRFERALDFPEALGRARFWWGSPDVARVHPGDRAFELAMEWMEAHRLGRKRVLDTALAAAYAERGIRRLATANPADFSVFGVFSFAGWAILG
jgi:predicted nucleic acid-binding protein